MNLRSSFHFLPATLALLLAFQAARAADKLTVEDGAIGPAVYKIVSPQKWNGRLILLAHGLRPDDAPLTAEFDYGPGTAMGELLKEGYIIASTSFRRNGWITTEAIEDLAAVRDKVIATHGTPAMTLVVGTSMGGAIATIVAEKNNLKVYQGALAVSAAIGGDGTDSKSLSHTPQIPLLFLSNQNEAAAPRAYVKAAFNGPVVPVLWTASRDGHANLTDAELLAAFNGLVKFVQSGTGEPNKDVTLSIAPPASKAAFHDNTAAGAVIYVDSVYGNIDTDLVASDLTRLGAKPGDRLTLSAAGQSAVAPWVKAYADVPKGEWLLFVTANGTVQIARNLANAAEGLKVKTGDKISIAPQAASTAQ